MVYDLFKKTEEGDDDVWHLFNKKNRMTQIMNYEDDDEVWMKMTMAIGDSILS